MRMNEGKKYRRQTATTVFEIIEYTDAEWVRSLRVIIHPPAVSPGSEIAG
jgi:hypothetical protein